MKATIETEGDKERIDIRLGDSETAITIKKIKGVVTEVWVDGIKFIKCD